MANTFAAAYENVHCEYALNAPLWNMLDTLYEGEYAMKKHDWQLANTQYSSYHVTEVAKAGYAWGEFIIRHNKHDTSEQARAQYFERVNMANLMNAYARTVDALQGQVFSKEATIELDGTGVEFLVDNVDGNGLTLAQQAQQALKQTLKKGRHGLLSDYPQRVDEEGNIIPSSAADIREGSVRPTITEYPAQHILDWRETVQGGVKKLTMVKLLEFIEDEEPNLDNSFCVEQGYQFRWLLLEDNRYYQVIEDSAGDRTGQIEITDAQGQALDHIPFSFCGSSNNSADVDKSPTLDLANVNVGHYRNSADSEEAAWLTAQPTLFMFSQYDPDEFKKMNPNGVCMGSRTGHNLGENGSAQLLQADERNQLNTLLEAKVEYMRNLGAALVTPQANVTAEATRIDKASEVSVLGMVAQNVEQAYRDRIRDCMLFQTGNAEVEFTLSFNDDFYASKMTAQELQVWIGGVQGGSLPRELFYAKMRNTGEIPSDYTDEQISELLENQQSNLPFTGSEE